MQTPAGDRSFRLARIFLLTGAIIGIHPFLVVLSVPLYLIGLVLLWRSNVGPGVKLRWVLWTLAGIVIAWLLIVGITWLAGG